MRLLLLLFLAGCSDAALEQRIVQLEAKQAVLVDENAMTPAIHVVDALPEQAPPE